MSFSIFVTAFKDEESTSISLSDIRRRFEPYIVGEIENGWHIKFSDHPSLPSDLTYRRMGADRIGGFSIDRPESQIAFWEIIAGILRDHPCVLYWPGTSAVMGSLDLLPHLPKVMVEKLGVPLVSIDPERIRQHVRDN